MTYATNADYLLDSGQNVSLFMDVELTDEEKEKQKSNSGERAYNIINDYLNGKTVIPARHIRIVKQIEIDFVLADVMTGAYTMETSNVSDWIEKYSSRAKEALNNIRYKASAEDVVANAENTGNGTIGAIVTNDMFTQTEQWILTCVSSTQFSIFGSVTGYLQNVTIGTQYPEADWTGQVGDYNFNSQAYPRFEQYPVSFKIENGSTVFVANDKFTFKTYQASFLINTSGRLERG